MNNYFVAFTAFFCTCKELNGYCDRGHMTKSVFTCTQQKKTKQTHNLTEKIPSKENADRRNRKGNKMSEEHVIAKETLEVRDDRMWVSLTYHCLELDKVVSWCTLPSCGAVLPFIGVTRDNFEDKKVVKLSYESFRDLALRQFVEICNEVFAREEWHGVQRIALHHAVGDVGVGGHSVICCVSGEHRKEVFEACEWIMFDLKKRVAIWKKEVFDDGESIWKENKEQFHKGA